VNRHVLLVARRELTETFRSRSYWVTMAVLLLAVAAGVVVPRLFDASTSYDLGLAGPAPDGIDQDLQGLAAAFDADLVVVALDDLAAAVAAVDGGEVDAAVVFGDDGPTLVRRAGTADALLAVAGQATVSASVRERLGAAGLDAAAAQEVLATPPPQELTVDGDQPGRSAAAYFLSLVLYLALLMGGMGVAQGVAVEKSSRIAEVLVATVRPAHLLAGKVLGIGTSTVLLLLAGAVPASLAVVVGAIDLPSVAVLDLLGGVGWFVLGYAIYATGFAALGALVDRQEDLGAAVGPAMVPLILAYFAAFQAQAAPTSTLARVTSIFPLSAPIVMPVRIAEGVVEPVEVVAAIVSGLVAFLLLVRVAGAVYQRALLRGGRRLSLREAFRS
jgi:ABC-2 type transport system permease protein